MDSSGPEVNCKRPMGRTYQASVGAGGLARAERPENRMGAHVPSSKSSREFLRATAESDGQDLPEASRFQLSSHLYIPHQKPNALF